MKKSGGNRYLFRFLKKEENFCYIAEYCLYFKDGDFLQEIYDHMEEDLFRREAYDTYVLDDTSLEKVAQFMQCDVKELVFRIFESCGAESFHFCDIYDWSVMSGSVSQAYERGSSDSCFSAFFANDLSRLKEVLEHLETIKNEAFSNARFLQRNCIHAEFLIAAVEGSDMRLSEKRRRRIKN